MIIRAFILATACLTGIAAALELHVSPRGMPDAAGTAESPLPGLTQARDAIRRLRKTRPLAEPVTVWVHGGTYETRDALILDVQDSGTAKFPVTYRAAAGETPVFIGGPKVGGFTVHQGKILKAGLKALELPKELPIRQLLFDGARQPLARYPNADPADPLYSGWSFIDEIPAGKSEGHAWKREAYLKAGDIRPWSKPEELEINVFAGHAWWNYILPVAAVDPAARKLTLARDCGYDLHPHNRYFIQNALEELDAPGEWYIDAASQTLYFHPPAPVAAADVRIPVATNFIKLRPGTRHVTIRGLSFTGCIGNAVALDGAENCTVAGCTFTTTGGWSGSAISLLGKNNLATGNEISFCGNSGITIDGGDRKTLSPANNIADNNHIHHPGMIQKNGAGIGLYGVGNKATHNHIHHTPRMAIQFSGNNLAIEYNHLHHTVLETQDGGAVYTGGRDWISSRGSTLKYNLIHDTIGCGQGADGLRHPHFTWGIYMDDNAGGLDITGNIVARSARAAIHLHNGRDHLIENNIFIDGAESQVEYSGWTADHPFFRNHHAGMIAGWDKVRDQPAWKALRNMDFDPRNAVRPDGTIMSGNIARRNIIAWKDPSVRYADLKSVSPAYNTFDQNLVWNGGHTVETAAIQTGPDTGPELSNHAALIASTPEGAIPRGWGWNHKPRKDLKLSAENGGILRIESATGKDPKNSKVSLHSPGIPIQSGAAYRTRMMIKGTRPSMRAGFSYAIFAAGGGYWQSDTRTFTAGTDWSEIEFTAVMPREKDRKPWMKRFWLRTDLSDDSGEVLIKDLTIHAAEVRDGWDAWQAAGWDKHSLVADPMFADWTKDDYRLNPASPAFKLGFKPIPVDKIGQYPSELRATR